MIEEKGEWEVRCGRGEGEMWEGEVWKGRGGDVGR